MLLDLPLLLTRRVHTRFGISAASFSMVLMGWGGASGLSPLAGIFFFTGPLLLTFAMVFEWIMGNFFPMMVMGLFSVFWLSFGVLQLPTLQLGAQYATEADPTGTTSPAYNAAIALYLIVWVWFSNDLIRREDADFSC